MRKSKKLREIVSRNIVDRDDSIQMSPAEETRLKDIRTRALEKAYASWGAEDKSRRRNFAVPIAITSCALAVAFVISGLYAGSFFNPSKELPAVIAQKDESPIIKAAKKYTDVDTEREIEKAAVTNIMNNIKNL